ncbi:enoyl-CoA hydratase-related protein [Actibacterium sp. D379-3]
MTDALVTRSDAGGVVTLTLNRPDKLNSFNAAMLARLRAAFDAIAADPAPRCVVLTGSGRAFSTGQDLGDREPILRGEGIDLGAALDAGFNHIVRTIAGLPIPVICAVNGVAAGAGANLALACDIVVAAHSAKFAQPFTRIGLIPDSGGTWFLPRLAGTAKANAIALLAETVTAEEAAQIGLIWKGLPDDALMPAVFEMAATIAGRPRQALALTKAALQASARNTLDAQLDLERDYQRQAGRTDDYRDAVAAFLTKRRAT